MTEPPVMRRSCRQKRTSIDDARRKRDELLKKQEAQAQAVRPKAAARALLGLVLWVNAHIAVLLTIIDSVIEIAALLSAGAVRQARSDPCAGRNCLVPGGPSPGH